MNLFGRTFISYCALVTTFTTLSVLADEEGKSSGDQDADSLEEIVVHAHPLSNEGVAQSYDVLVGEQLARAVEATIGETLEAIPGIRNASFGPVVGRPVIHGLGGVRVKNMLDRTSTMDLSLLSPDHPVAVNPHMANLIEVIKGPSAMVYGSESIGGIVNVDTGRVPKVMPTDGWDARLDANMSDNASGETFAGRIDLGVENVILHADIDFRQADDYDFPGCANSPYLEEAEAEEHHEEEEEEEPEEEHDEICGTLTNSFYELAAGSLGGSYVTDLGHFGVSISSNSGEFGIPVAHAHGEEEEEEEEEGHHDEEEEPRAVTDFEQQRLDLDFRRQEFSDAIDQMQIRLAISEFQHDELHEAGGPIDATFINDAYEFRVEATLEHENTSVVGAHLSSREYEVITAEDPVLPVTASRLGLSWLHERNLGSSTLELGTRIEGKKVDSEEFGDRNFSDYALSLGLLSDRTRDWTFKVEMSQSSRAPAIEELASRGFHAATNAIEIGNPDLDNETQTGFTIGAAKQGGKLDLDLTAYHRRFADFIYIANSGEFDHGAPVFTYLHRDATFTGIDGTALYHLALNDSTELDLRLQYDTLAITANRSSENRLPQMPAERVAVGLELYRPALFANLVLTHNAAAKNTALFELPTDSWYDLSTRVEYTLRGLGDAADVTIYLKGKNLTDEVQRNHISTIKDRVPLPGRTLSVGFRVSI